MDVQKMAERLAAVKVPQTPEMHELRDSVRKAVLKYRSEVEKQRKGMKPTPEQEAQDDLATDLSVLVNNRHF